MGATSRSSNGHSSAKCGSSTCFCTLPQQQHPMWTSDNLGQPSRDSRCTPFQRTRRYVQLPVPFSTLYRTTTTPSFVGGLDSNIDVSAFSLSTPTTTTNILPTTSFEPQLSIPALSVFLFIGAIFVALQWRVSAIEAAVEKRTAALRHLRVLKAKELSDSSVAAETVSVAVQNYKQAYRQVEELRTVIPGVRVIPPPSQSVNRQSMEENEAAAFQFLGIAPERRPEDKEASSGDGKLTSPFLTALLIAVALSQVALLLLLTMSDPMASVSDGSINSMSMGR